MSVSILTRLVGLFAALEARKHVTVLDSSQGIVGGVLENKFLVD